MSIIIHGAPLSPFVRKTRIFLAEKGLDYNLKMAIPYALPEDYTRLNPLRRVPAMEDGEVTLADSAVICHYLERQHQAPALMPGSPADNARCEWLEKYADYELAAVTTFTIFRQRVLMPLNRQPTDEARISAAYEQELPPLLDYLERELGGQAWFLGEAFSLADIAIACQLINMEHTGLKLDAARWPRLGSFLERCYARPSIDHLMVQERAMLRKLLG